MFALRILWRDWRGGELGILTAALVLAVAIVTGIALFTDRLQQGLSAQSSHFLAADRVLQSPRPVDPAWLQQARVAGLQQAELVTFQSMIYAGANADAGMRLASVKAVSERYPLRGLLDISDQPFGEPYKVASGPPVGEVWLDARLLPLLDIAIGDAVYVGDAKLTVTRTVVNEPDRGSGFSAFGPRVMMNTGDLAATHIIQPGSRVNFRYLFAGDIRLITEYGRWLQSRLEPSHKWLVLKDVQPRIAQSLERAEQFLLLAGAIGVGLAGIAIALAARRYTLRHYDYVAMMKSLGASSQRVMNLYIGNLLILALLSTLLGCGAGWLIQQVFFELLEGIFAVAAMPEITPRPFLIGAVTALVCLLAFAVPPLINLQRVSPLRVLRRDLPHAGASALVAYSTGIAGMALLMLWYSGNWRLTLAVIAGVAVTFVVVGAITWYLLRGSVVVGMQAGSHWHLALASLRRRGFENAVQVVIFSLSIMLLLSLALVRSSLIEEWKIQLPEGTPNHFLINVNDAQVASVKQLLTQNQLNSEPVYPMVRGRLISINGEQVRARLLENDQSSVGDELDRELNITWTQRIPSGNQLVAGEWWQPDDLTPQVSVESGLAQRLGADIGDSLVFSIGSELLEVKISSLRSLNWDSMKPNFYMIFPPKILAAYPATYITSFYLPTNKKPLLNQFIRQFPTVTVIEMDSILAQIRAMINQVGAAIELVLALIVACGLLVLVASVQASLDSRFHESAILRTLGAKRSLVLGSLVTEFSLLGMVAGLLAAFSAELCVYAIQHYVLHMNNVSHPWVWLAGPMLGAVLIGATGYVVCRKVVNSPPMQILRELS